MLRRKTAFLICCLVLTLFCLLSGCSQTLTLAESAGASSADHITLTWEEDPRTTQTISWRTDAGTIAGQVEFAPAVAPLFPSSSTKTVIASYEPMSTNLGEMNIHSATLTGLKPGTRYVYRVGAPGDWSEVHTFKTAPLISGSFKFLIFGDSQSGNYNIWRTTLQQSYAANPDAAFFINMGDLVDVGQDYVHWNGWFDAVQGVADTIPVMPLVGNHETYTPERRFSMPLYFTSQFRLPLNGPEGLKRQVYSFDYGDVHFVMLDSQAGEEREFAPSMLSQQKEWLAKDLAATTKSWKLIFIHRPPYNNKAAGDNASIREAFVPIIDQYHVDMVFSGHDHVYARTYPLKSGEIADNTEQGTIYVATGRSGSKTYKDPFAQDWNEFFYNPIEEPNYLTVAVEKKDLTIKAFAQSGALIDAWSIHKL